MSTLTSTGLKKSFDNKAVIHDISLEVKSGEIDVKPDSPDEDTM